MQPFRRQDMGHHQVVQRRQHAGAGADLVGQGRQADLDALAGEALALPVERLVLAELLEQHHRQQAFRGGSATAVGPAAHPEDAREGWDRPRPAGWCGTERAAG